MSQPRAKTLQQRMGFDDPDLRSPSHDAMVLWIAEHVRSYVEKDWDFSAPVTGLLKIARQLCAARGLEFAEKLDKNVAELAQTERIAPYNKSFLENQINSIREHCQKLEQFCQHGFDLPESQPVKIQTIFEHAVTTNSDYIVGFVDVLARVEYPVIQLVGVDAVRGKHYLQDERTIPKLGVFNEQVNLYFEAKPAISSLGELLRQIRTYQQYERGRFIVVSPDTRFREAIVSQKIEFWECPKL